MQETIKLDPRKIAFTSRHIDQDEKLTHKGLSEQNDVLYILKMFFYGWKTPKEEMTTVIIWEHTKSISSSNW